jgi:hypothetical protein
MSKLISKLISKTLNGFAHCTPHLLNGCLEQQLFRVSDIELTQPNSKPAGL